MFEFVDDIVRQSKNSPASPNVFFPVSLSDVRDAEARLKHTFPEELKAFFQEIGCGFLKAGTDDLSRTTYNYVNRFLDPEEIAAVSLGEDEDMAPNEGFAANELPFFEIADQLYLVFRPSGNHPRAVCWPFGDQIAIDLVDFVRQLSTNARFYHPRSSPSAN